VSAARRGAGHTVAEVVRTFGRRDGRARPGRSVRRLITRARQERDEDTADIFIELTAQGLGKSPAAELWRRLVAVDTSFFTSPLAEELRDEGRAEGRAEGKAEAILRLLDRRGIEVSSQERERIAACDDLDLLDLWFDRAIAARSAREVFAEAG
jgi:hypothetical protein